LIHDPVLLDQLSLLPTEVFDGEVFRATRRNLDPLAFSTRAGRWGRDGGTAILYTSLESNGALAEIVFHWSQLTPLPSKPIMLHRLQVKTKNSVRLLRANLAGFAVDASNFGSLDYSRTQEIGEACTFLGYDGLIAPSARWNYDNLILFNDNQSIESDFTVVSSEIVDWIEWGKNRESYNL
jgi:hypothetical protein